MTMRTLLQQVLTALVLAHVCIDCGLGLVVEHPGDQEENKPLSSLSLPANTDSAPTPVLRQKRAPGWGKRSQEDVDAFDGEDMLNDLEDEAEPVDLKRAPGWGKRDFDTDKRAPGWGKRAPGWGKRAPGWGKRAPGWGKRAPGWGKRAPGWGKRSSLVEDAEEKRAPGWGKRAPGWGKRAPGWGKRAPGWGKRSLEGESDECKVWSEELDFFMDKAIEAETRLQALCGRNTEVFDLLSRK